MCTSCLPGDRRKTVGRKYMYSHRVLLTLIQRRKEEKTMDVTRYLALFLSRLLACFYRYRDGINDWSRLDSYSYPRACERSVSGAWAVKKPLHVPTYFYNPRSPLRSRSATSRSTLRPAPAFFCNSRSPLRSTRFSARYAPTIKLRSRTNGGQINYAIFR